MPLFLLNHAQKAPPTWSVVCDVTTAQGCNADFLLQLVPLLLAAMQYTHACATPLPPVPMVMGNTLRQPQNCHLGHVIRDRGILTEHRMRCHTATSLFACVEGIHGRLDVPCRARGLGPKRSRTIAEDFHQVCPFLSASPLSLSLTCAQLCSDRNNVIANYTKKHRINRDTMMLGALAQIKV